MGTSITDKPQWQLDYEKYMAAIGGKKNDGSDKAAQEAAARAAAELSAIKKAGEIKAGVLASQERMLETLHTAGLIDERAYYAQKRDLLTQSNAAADDALQKEIIRLQAEKLTGKAKIDNDRKIADTQADLVKQRQTAATSLAVLGIQEAAQLKAIAQGYRDAEDAAQAYLDTIRQAQARELSGMGLGDRERNRTAGRAQIEDKYSQQRQDLEKSRRDAELGGTFGPDAQAKYDNELERIKRFNATALSEYDAFYAQRTRQEGDWAIGAGDALANYLSESANVAAQSQQAFTNAFSGMEDALVTFITTGKLSFSSLANSIVSDITRIIVKQQISNAMGVAGSGGGGDLLTGLVGAVMTGGSVAGAFKNATGNFDAFAQIIGGNGRASGGPVSAGSMYQVNERGPELLNVAGKQYLMMGPQGGSVTPNNQSAGNSVSLVINQSFAQGTSRQTTLQAAADASRQLQYAGRNL
jgi:lambda family phage tail tape measure protein